MDGFISIERFQSLSEPDKLLSLSFWRDEAAVANWRRTTAGCGTIEPGAAAPALADTPARGALSHGGPALRPTIRIDGALGHADGRADILRLFE